MRTEKIRYFTHYWSIGLYEQLKTYVKGKVYVDISADYLIVTIYGQTGTVFRWTLAHSESAIAYGLDSKTVAQTIVKKYKNFVLNQYFL